MVTSGGFISILNVSGSVVICKKILFVCTWALSQILLLNNFAFHNIGIQVIS